ncbi:MAG: metallophosphoesterase [Nanoarchaeota archaeon]
MQIIWLTDIHLDHVGKTEHGNFLNKIIKIANENIREKTCVVVTGDIGNSMCTIPYMESWKTVLLEHDISLYFVYGNHDYYGSSVKVERERLASSTLKDNWLGGINSVVLSEKSALIGHDGWYDGGYANWFKSNIDMNDYYQIFEINRQWYDKGQIFEKINQLSMESAAHVFEQGTKLLSGSTKTLVIATHIPPYRENSVFMGNISDDNWLPHFSSKHMGDAITNLGKNFPEKDIVVLCGHSHGQAKHMPLPNIVSFTSEARYKHPVISDVFVDL